MIYCTLKLQPLPLSAFPAHSEPPHHFPRPFFPTFDEHGQCNGYDIATAIVLLLEINVMRCVAHIKVLIGGESEGVVKRGLKKGGGGGMWKTGRKM